MFGKMSDFVPQDMLPDLWEEILKRHWTFLETEESIQKLEERKKLEGCLKEFLCIVPHDRKFFLPETAHVLRKSVREMDDFTAYKGIVGFDSISQYANNLFTKPWRKEFRVLKMYSGFFQHEIKSNLVDAEKLFEAMGYRRLSDEILILDGPICPDQVTNVSRDAMAAYVECQIMKHIYAGLVALGLTCSWQDVLHYREKYVGGTTQAIKGLAYAIQERRLRKEKQANADNCYATIQHSPQSAGMLPVCLNCAPYHMQPHAHAQLSNGQCPLHHNAANNNNYGLHPALSNNKMLSSYPAGANYQHLYGANGAQPHMSHSRSLEHYNEPPAPHLPHRHSFDHQPQSCAVAAGPAAAHHYQQPHGGGGAQHVYESPYDCLDGVSMGSSVSYAAVAAGNLNAAYAHPYNVSGNRYPLPYNISNQLAGSAHYATPTSTAAAAAAAVTCNGVKGSEPPSSYPNLDNSDYATVSKPAYACSYHAQPPVPRHNSASAAVGVGAANAKELQQMRAQRSFPPQNEQLIDFDDRAPLTAHDFHGHLHAGSFDYEQERAFERQGERRANMNATYAQPKDLLYQQPSGAASSSTQLPSSSDDLAYGNYVYARPQPRGSRSRGLLGGPAHATDKYLRNAEPDSVLLDNNRKMPMAELKERSASAAAHMHGGRRKLATYPSSNERDTSDLSYESATFDDFVNVGHSERPAALMQRSPTQASKNQDGVGSFESWDYVFQNLERSGYSKDLGEREDLLVQSLDLDSLKLANGATNGTEKRRGNHAESSTTKLVAGRQVAAQERSGEKSRTLEKVPSAAEKRDSKATSKQESKSILKQKNSYAGNSNKTKKSALKSSAATAAHVSDNNNGNGFGAQTEIRHSTRKAAADTVAGKRQSAAQANNTRASNNSGSGGGSKQAPAVSTQVIVSSPNEWSCRFCTFLNPDTKRICEMCCRSKDFNPDAATAASVVSNTPTCV